MNEEKNNEENNNEENNKITNSDDSNVYVDGVRYRSNRRAEDRVGRSGAQEQSADSDRHRLQPGALQPHQKSILGKRTAPEGRGSNVPD